MSLRDAMITAGRARFGKNWNGWELKFYFPPELPLPLNIARGLFQEMTKEEGSNEIARWAVEPPVETLRYAERLLAALSPQNVPKYNALAALMMGPIKPSFTVHQWLVAMDLAKNHRQLCDDAWLRLFEVQKYLREAFVSKRIRTLLRPKAGGDFGDYLPWWAWNSETIWARFKTFQMNPTDYFHECPSAEQTHWIFVDVAELDADVRRTFGVAGMVKVESQAQLPRYLSPYLQCALDVINGERISEANMPKKAELEAIIPKYWKGKEPLSERMIEAIAKIIRDDESQGGMTSKYSKQRVRSKKVGVMHLSDT